MRSIYMLVLIAGMALAFGVPGVPDVPDTEIPDFEIPGMELLDEVQLKLDGLLSETDALRNMIPDLAVLDELSLKLEELRDTDPELEALQAEVDALRNELVEARVEITAISDGFTAEVSSMKAVVDEFTAGLPIQ
ncbi:MAG: hypothetical protein K8S62_04010 [Candidatus Sabulitectum sp.]|nr:hypothetical protein [Candidatus Sabulitectum sp.]